ncbi:MAG TPA: phosphoadenylyl-sulfate reductase [Acidimicrobiia bacterium]|nr:phosphoadenylyl-sulfate reductase [Acidimicrobiia bacterium]
MNDLTTAPTPALLEELESVNARFEREPATASIDWALERFGGSVVLACSFQDLVIVDLVRAREPDIEVVFLDTGAHFEQTLDLVERARARYRLNLVVTSPAEGAEEWPCGSARCCEFRKVEPLRRVLAGRAAWITGLKRADSAARADIPIVGYDDAFGLVKVNPLATWTDDDIVSYEADHDLLVHPLMRSGYRSIGCAPTTRPVADGEDPRAGRWAGSDKTECGLHG